ncbi:MAG: U32 family peptidase [Clostridia bacterium]|nr:U32 family peptidase [Clostridia bacterium]
MKKIELLSPAGNFEKLEMALAYGADAVYFGGMNYSMRSAADNFTKDEMKAAVDLAHSLGKKAFVTINIMPRNADLPGIIEEMEFVNNINADAIIISDAGLVRLAARHAPDTAVHISTQANILNSETARLYSDLGAKRLILARELSLEEIKDIRTQVPKETEIEVFVHGSMCVSYSGRCLISNYLTGRDSNRGECAQPCRWKYSLVEEKRPGEYFPVFEDENGSYFFNSKDLCLIEHIPELIDSGIDSFKIEGRMKTVFYTAMTARSYRKAIDAYYINPGAYKLDNSWLEDLKKTSHRDYTDGFIFGNKPDNMQIYDKNSYIRTHSFVGKVMSYNKGTGLAKIMQRNPLFDGDEIEIIQPGGDDFSQIATGMTGGDKEKILSTPHAQMIYYIKTKFVVEPGALLIKKNAEVD